MKTINSPFFCETEEKRSRFLAFLMPYPEYEGELARLRTEHPKANHHVSAFRYFDADKRLHEGAKDDGEPSGSAGMPALKFLQGEDLVNVAVIIVRYFGGIKLGTGGMARAYGGAAKAVIDVADLQTFNHQATATFTANFDRTSDLERLLQATNITDRRYTESGIEIDISDDEEIVEGLEEQWERINY
ncbi:YigZ family protein [Terasakiella sp. A23]|uniref:IMPACT family protein n=1 Tax=Terasakiella sp. FCG-A23 TaxID=3080561 RepID=UPI00295409BD|nr:YigZ family protein [Terasakiella sp. A23]MDV7339121.1 YigZ family protein [Terasakiella sp. A23]